MNIITKITTALAAVVHLLFFCMESLFWHTTRVQKIFHMTAENAEITSLMAFNQGFYNLFLALGSIIALFLLAQNKKSEGTILLIFTNLCMVGAATVLFFSAPGMLRGVIIQGALPAIALISLSLVNKKK